MEFLMITIGALVVLAVIAAIASRFDKGSDEIVTASGCDDCTGREDCKLMELKKQCGKKVER